MKIEPTFPTATRENFRHTVRATRPRPSHAWPAFERSRSLEPDLTTAPEVRADVVARGKALIADANYPSREQIQKIAGVLAAHWSRPNARPAATGCDGEPLA